MLAVAHKVWGNAHGHLEEGMQVKDGEGGVLRLGNVKVDLGWSNVMASIMDMFPSLVMTMADIMQWLSSYKCYGFGNMSLTLIKKERGMRSWADVV